MSRSVIQFKLAMAALTSCFVLLGLTCTAYAEMTHAQRRAVLQEATVAFDDGIAQEASAPDASRLAFTKAAERYQQLIDDGVRNGWLHFNLGNALERMDDQAGAVHQYRQALQLIPGEGEIRQNLKLAREAISSPFATELESGVLDTILTWSNIVPVELRMTITIVSWCVCWIFVGVCIIRHGGRVPLLIAGVACLIALAGGVSVGKQVLQRDAPVGGVLIQDEVVPRLGDGTGYEAVFVDPLPGGIEVEVLQLQGDWIQVRFPDQEIGWVPSQDIGLIWP